MLKKLMHMWHFSFGLVAVRPSLFFMFKKQKSQSFFKILIIVFLQPQMDEKIQLGPRAQVTWVKGSSGGAKASDSGKMPQQAETSLAKVGKTELRRL